MRGNWFIKFAAFVLAVVGLFALFAVTCARAECFDCLTRASDWQEAKFADRKVKGDIVTCQPAGFKYTANERGLYTVERLCDITPAEASAEQVDKDGLLIGKKRFKTMTAMGQILIIDKVTDQIITPADAKAAVDLEPKALVLEVKK